MVTWVPMDTVPVDESLLDFHGSSGRRHIGNRVTRNREDPGDELRGFRRLKKRSTGRMECWEGQIQRRYDLRLEFE